MIPDDIDPFAELMAGLGEIWGPKSEHAIEIYFRALQDMSFDDVNRGVNTVISTRTTATFPKPAEIREAALIREQVDELTAAEAWNEVQRLIMQCAGRTATPVFSSARVEQACMAVGGINTIWMAGLEQEGMYRAQFTRAYEGMSAKQHTVDMIGRDEATAVLHGIYAQIEEEKAEE